MAAREERTCRREGEVYLELYYLVSGRGDGRCRGGAGSLGVVGDGYIWIKKRIPVFDLWGRIEIGLSSFYLFQS